jgi:hypothetical protein
MKLMKMFGLAMVAAIATMAFIGASSASAVTACKVNTNPCPEGQLYPSGTVVKAKLETGTKAVLTTNLATVECSVSESVGKSTATEGSPLPGLITSLTFKECKTTAGVECTVTVVNLNVEAPYKADITASGSGNGVLNVLASSLGNPGATVVCASVIKCTFTTPEAKLSITGGEPAKLFANAISLEQKGEICPTTSTWTAHYVVTEPIKAWIEALP